MKLAVSLLGLVVLVGGAIADTENPILSSYFVVPKDQTTMRAIADRFEVHHRLATGFEVIVPADKARDLLSLAPDARLIVADMDAETAWQANQTRGYHTYQTVEEHLKRIEAEHPNLAKVEVYGKSKEGRSLFALKLSDNSQLDEAEPELMITSATHGDELITVEVLMGIVDALVEGYAASPRVRAMVDDHELYFLPVINPDGYVKKNRYANGVDPNREYPYPEVPSRNPNPCIKSVMDFFDSHAFVGSLDYHSAMGTFMYPWSYTEGPVDSADEKVMEALTAKMAATNGYTHGQIPDVVYIAKGASADYYYWKKRALALAVEIHGTNVPSTSQIPSVLQKSLEAAYLFIEHFR